MTFGEKKIVSENLTASVDYYDSFTNVFFSVFRIAVVDEYDYDVSIIFSYALQINISWFKSF